MAPPAAVMPKKFTATQMDKVVMMAQQRIEHPDQEVELPPRAKPGPKPKPKPDGATKSEAAKKRPAPTAAPAPAAKKPKQAAAPKAAPAPKAAKAKETKVSPAPKAASKPAAASKASPASSKKKASPKAEKEEEVRKVERIVGVKANKAGETEFLIKWTGLNPRENTWEPEAHILDDTLIDEYMKSKLVKMAPSSGKYAVGASVEVLGESDGFEYSWAPAKVTKVSKAGRYDVEFDDFMDGKKKLTESGIELGRLRPKQPKSGGPKWKPTKGELIEVFEDDCWWEGKALEVATEKKKEVVKVMLRVSDEKKSYALGNARPSCWWGKKG